MNVIQSLRAIVNEDFEKVNHLIKDKIQSEVNLIDDLSSHIINSGGKRLRPLLVLLTTKACGYRGNHHILLAAMIEFFHTATLLHDDVVDESTLRRGSETAHVIWGRKASILVGDYLLSIYMKLMLEINNLQIMHLLVDLAHDMGQGEIKQLANRNNITLSEETYFEIIQAKTSRLFAEAAAASGILAGSENRIWKALRSYGLHVGNAYQLIDDMLDYCADETRLGKNIGNDLADGKLTLPLLYALKEGTPKQQSLIKESLGSREAHALPEILNAITETRAIEYTRGIADNEIAKAVASLDELPPSIYKEGLINLATYAVERTH